MGDNKLILLVAQLALVGSPWEQHAPLRHLRRSTAEQRLPSDKRFALLAPQRSTAGPVAAFADFLTTTALMFQLPGSAIGTPRWLPR